MDLRDTPDEAQFRSELQAWLEANVPAPLRGHRGGAARFSDDAVRDWSRALYEAGYIGLTWPKEYGGGGKPYSYQAIFLEELARAEAPQHLGVIGLGMAGPTIIASGTEAQKARYLQPHPLGRRDLVPGLLGAGRRLRPLGREDERAARRVAHFVVDGQKVWSSYAHIADWCILLTRSDPDSERPRRAHVPDRRHEGARRRGAAAAPDHGRGGVQRDLLHRRRGAGRERRSATSAAAGRSR